MSLGNKNRILDKTGRGGAVASLIQKKLVGPNAGVLKYDLLTAIGLIGCHGPKSENASLTRLSTLITARYNWRREELSVPQGDMATMLNVTERTIKRDVKLWTDKALLKRKRTGVRGRVGSFQLNISGICDLSQPFWEFVGLDYFERMTDLAPPKEAKVVQVNFAKHDNELPQTTSPWRKIVRRLTDIEPEKCSNWIGKLEFVSDDGSEFRLRAPSSFIAQYVQTHLGADLDRAIRLEVGATRRLLIEIDN